MVVLPLHYYDLKLICMNPSLFPSPIITWFKPTDIRINQDVYPLANANVTYYLTPFDGIARVFIDRAQFFLFSPHTLTTDQISALSSAFFNGVQHELGDTSFSSFIIQSGFHAELEGISSAKFIATHVSSEKKAIDSIIGHSVTYYLGQEGQRSHSSVTLVVPQPFFSGYTSATSPFY